MEDELKQQDVPFGMLLVQGGCLPQQVRAFVQAAQGDEPLALNDEQDEDIKFRVLPAASVPLAVEKGDIDVPSLWVDEAEAASGTAALRVAFRLGDGPQTCRLPFKAVKLQPMKRGGSDASLPAYKAFISAKLHLQLYRLVHLLFPTLGRWDQELRRGDVLFASSQQNQDSGASNVDAVRAMPVEQGLLLERHDPLQGVTVKLQVAINFPHGCLELQRVDGASGSGPGGRAKCLRTLHSLDEALQALRGQSTQLLASPSSSPRKLGSIHPVFQSPAKAPRRRLQYERQAREGVQLVQSCSSAQLRDGAIMLQAAASVPEGAAEAVDAGAMEALVGAAASMLPSTVMGTTEQLTLLTLTCATLLDASSAMSGPQRGAAAERLVGALAAALSDTCANPVLLCKLLLALLQRPDVRLEAVRQGLATAISSAYLRKSPLLEPLAAALLSPAPPSGRAHSSSPGGMTLQASATPPSSGHGLGAGRTPSPMPTGLRLSGTKLSVPRLHLQSEEESPTGPATGGLTRATRRDLSLSPTEWEPPSAAATPPWATPRPRSANKDVSAAAEMAQMAEALGESLMAMDLPSTVAHKRSADALKAPKSDDSIPKELLEGPLLTARQQTLQAHRIFTAVGSVQSVASSSEAPSIASAQGGEGTKEGTDGPSEGQSVGNSQRLQVADAAEVKCLLLQAMLDSLPALGIETGPAEDPSPILAAEVLSMPTGTHATSLSQDSLRSNCLKLLSRLSRRAELRRSLEPHVFLIAAGRKLTQLLGGGGRVTRLAATQGAHLLHAVASYLDLVAAPSVAVAVARHCLGPIGFALSALQSSGAKLANWDQASWELLHAVLLVMAPAATHCADADAGRAILTTLLADYKAAVVLTAVGDGILLRAGEGPVRIAYPGRVLALQRDLLGLFSALAGLVGRQPAMPGGASLAGDKGHDVLLVTDDKRSQVGKLTRRQGLNFFASLVAPGNPFLRCVLDNASDALVVAADGSAVPLPPPSSTAVRLRQGLFDLLCAVFSAPGSPYVMDKPTADYFVRFHFTQFLKLYHNPDRDHQATFLCRKHMATLLVLAQAGGDAGPHVRHRFLQLSVVDFFVRELALEFEVNQPGVATMHRSDSSFSDVGPVSTSGGPKSGAGARFARIGSWKASPAGSARDSPLVGQQPGSQGRHKRGLSLTGNDLLEGNQPTPSPRVPKLRLPGSGDKLGGGDAPSSPALSPGSVSSGAAGRPSSRFGSPRVTSRIGREAATQAANAAAAASSSSQDTTERPAVPKLGLGALGLSLESPDAEAPSNPQSVTSGDGRISAAASVPPLQLAGGQGRPHPPGLALPPRPLERFISAAISLDAEWPASGRAGPSDSKEETLEEESEEVEASEEHGTGSRRRGGRRRWPSGSSVGSLPTGFAFTGDLDADVELLEALEQHEDDSDASSDDSSVSPHRAPQTVDHTPEDAVSLPPLKGPTPPPRLAIPRLTVPPKLTLSPDEASSSTGVPQLPDSPPARASGPAVPRLAITPSMHSTLEARTASAEMQVAEEAEQARRKAGRSFFGDLEKRALGKGKMQAATVTRRGSRSAADLQLGAAAPDVSYAEERQRRMLYRDDDLHLQILVLVFTLILDARGQLDWAYCDQYPWYRKLQNIPFVLHHHLNHPDNRPILPRLLAQLHDLGPPALRLLRTLCSTFFRPAWYARRARISGVAGAYATVYRCALPEWTGGASVVLKLLDAPKHIQDRCAQVDFHSEVTILDALAGRPSACKMYDFGLDIRADALVLVLKDYKCSLKQWRQRQPTAPAHQLRLYYAIFREILVAVRGLFDSGVVHFDLKSDNILLEPLPGTNPVEFWAPMTGRPPFRVVLGDFGESKMLGEQSGEESYGQARGAADGATTSRARGTDAFKSPEMLLVGGALQKTHRTYDRRRQQGAGAASDVWSLGCLLFELVTGKLLFSDNDWLQLVARVTSPGMQLITDERAQLVADLPGVLELLQYMLVRDPALRPTLRDSLAKLDAIMAINGHRMPAHVPPPPPTAAAVDSWGGGSAPDPPPTTAPREPALPLSCILAYLPTLLLGPISAVQQAPQAQQVLRSKRVHRVVVVTSGEGASVEDSHGLALPLLDIMGSEELSSCAETCAAAGASCEIIRGPPGFDPGSLVAWVEEALPAIVGGSRGSGHSARGAPVLVVAEEECVGDAVLLAVAHLVKGEGASAYQAMVRAAHICVDLHMTAAHLEAVRMLTK